jgi:hypothetical protein
MSAPANDAVGKPDARFPTAEFAHLKAGDLFAVHVEATAITLRRDEHLIIAAFDHLGKVRIELYDRTAARQLRAVLGLKRCIPATHHEHC